MGIWRDDPEYKDARWLGVDIGDPANYQVSITDTTAVEGDSPANYQVSITDTQAVEG